MRINIVEIYNLWINRMSIYCRRSGLAWIHQRDGWGEAVAARPWAVCRDSDVEVYLGCCPDNASVVCLDLKVRRISPPGVRCAACDSASGGTSTHLNEWLRNGLLRIPDSVRVGWIHLLADCLLCARDCSVSILKE